MSYESNAKMAYYNCIRIVVMRTIYSNAIKIMTDVKRARFLAETSSFFIFARPCLQPLRMEIHIHSWYMPMWQGRDYYQHSWLLTCNRRVMRW